MLGKFPAMSDEELLVSSCELLRHLVAAGVVYLFEGEMVRGGEHHHRVVHRILLLLLGLKWLHVHRLKDIQTHRSISPLSVPDQRLKLQ